MIAVLPKSILVMKADVEMSEVPVVITVVVMVMPMIMAGPLLMARPFFQREVESVARRNRKSA